MRMNISCISASNHNYAKAIYPLVLFAALLFVRSQICAQSSPAQLVGEVDLKPFGVTAPKAGNVSSSSMELLFLSDSRLAVLEENNPTVGRRTASLMIYEIEGEATQLKKMVDLGSGVVPISSPELQLGRALEWDSPDHLAYWRFPGEPVRQICDVDLNCKVYPGEAVTPTIPHLANCGFNNLLGLIDAHRGLCLKDGKGTRLSAVALDRD
jgi:hypothetical protein